MVSDLLIEGQNAKLGNSTITVKWTSPQTGVVGYSFDTQYTILEEANYAWGILNGTINSDPLLKTEFTEISLSTYNNQIN